MNRHPRTIRTPPPPILSRWSECLPEARILGHVSRPTIVRAPVPPNQRHFPLAVLPVASQVFPGARLPAQSAGERSIQMATRGASELLRGAVKRLSFRNSPLDSQFSTLTSELSALDSKLSAPLPPPAAVDVDRLTSDVGGQVAGKKDDHVSDLGWFGEPPQRHVGEHRLAVFFRN